MVLAFGRLHHVALLHHDDAVAVGGRQAEIMGDEDGGHAARTRQLHDQVHHRLLGGDVEAGGGLIRDQELRPAGERESDHHALAHAARELERIGVVALLRPRDAHLLQDGDGLLGLVVGAGLRVLTQHVLDLVADLADRVQRRARVLEDHGDLAPAQVAHLALTGLAHVDAGKRDGAFGDTPGAIQDAHHGIRGDGFAGPGFPDDGEGFALRYGDVDVPDGLHRAAARGELDGQIANVEQRNGCHA